MQMKKHKRARAHTHRCPCQSSPKTTLSCLTTVTLAEAMTAETRCERSPVAMTTRCERPPVAMTAETRCERPPVVSDV